MFKASRGSNNSFFPNLLETSVLVSFTRFYGGRLYQFNVFFFFFLWFLRKTSWGMLASSLFFRIIPLLPINVLNRNTLSRCRLYTLCYSLSINTLSRKILKIKIYMYILCLKNILHDKKFRSKVIFESNPFGVNTNSCLNLGIANNQNCKVYKLEQ